MAGRRIGPLKLICAAVGSALLALGVGGALFLLELGSASTNAASATASVAKAQRAYGKLPLRFEPNRGQTDSRVKFLARGEGYAVFLTDREVVLSLSDRRSSSPDSDSRATLASREEEPVSATVRIRPVGGNPNAVVNAGDRQAGQSNYLGAGDSAKRLTGVPGYGRVSYREVYPGVDLVYYGNQRKLEYDFVVAPGADPKPIALDFQGAKKLSLDSQGDLLLHTRAGTVRQQAPFVYQRVGKEKKRVEGRYVLEGKDRVGFSLGAYDRARPLVIDPVLAYSTSLGGSADDFPRGIAVADGCASDCETYVTGTTKSRDFPTKDPYQSVHNGHALEDRDVFVLKLNASGTALVYSTYLGGSQEDLGRDIAVDGSGSAYVTGQAGSANESFDAACQPNCKDFPTTQNTMQGYGGGFFDAFITKLDPSGSKLTYSTFLGGFHDDIGTSIALLPGCVEKCEAYVTGQTDALNFPTKNPLEPLVGQGFYGGVNGGREDPTVRPIDAFVTKVNASASALVYSTYLGGRNTDAGEAIAVDAAGSAYLTGQTRSANFPTVNPIQGDRGLIDAFVAKIDPSGSRLSYSTYLGGDQEDISRGIGLDASGSAYVVGETRSPEFPTKNAYQSKLSGLGDAFVTKLGPSGAALSYSTYLGGSDFDRGFDIAVDAFGSAYPTGITNSDDFPTENPLQKAGNSFLTKLEPSGATLSYSTYLTFSSGAVPLIALDRSGSAYLANGGANRDVFVSKLSPLADLSLAMTATPDPVTTGEPLTYVLSVRNLGPEAAGARLRDVLPAGVQFVSASPGCAEAAGIVTCQLAALASGATGQVQIIVRPTVANSALSNTASVQGAADPQDANNSSTATTEVRQAAASVPGGGAPSTDTTAPGDGGLPTATPPAAPAPTGGGGLPTATPLAPALAPVGAGASTALTAALARERSRARAMAACLVPVTRHTRRENRLARSGSVRARRLASRHARSHARVLRGRCSRRHGRTPGQVTGLNASALARKELVLSFRAPGSDGATLPPARSYLVKQSSTPIKDLRGFKAAQSLCKGACRFQVTRVGEQVKLKITDLRPRTDYYYAIAALDNVSRRLGPRSQTLRVRMK
ncbi:MAG: SBBP repeat-containing protein [Solirubrobacteraceae bacterium]